jgi:hypothetical protein
VSSHGQIQDAEHEQGLARLASLSDSSCLHSFPPKLIMTAGAYFFSGNQVADFFSSFLYAFFQLRGLKTLIAAPLFEILLIQASQPRSLSKLLPFHCLSRMLASSPWLKYDLLDTDSCFMTHFVFR